MASLILSISPGISSEPAGMVNGPYRSVLVSAASAGTWMSHTATSTATSKALRITPSFSRDRPPRAGPRQRGQDGLAILVGMEVVQLAHVAGFQGEVEDRVPVEPALGVLSAVLSEYVVEGPLPGQHSLSPLLRSEGGQHRLARLGHVPSGLGRQVVAEDPPQPIDVRDAAHEDLGVRETGAERGHGGLEAGPEVGHRRHGRWRGGAHV